MSNSESLLERLDTAQRTVFNAVRQQCSTLLDTNTKFKYFTLHGSQHIENMLNIAGLLVDGGIDLSIEDSYILSLSICLHDIGMVTTLNDVAYKQIFNGLEQVADPASLESYIRDNHNQLIDKYVENNFNFLTGLGVPPSLIATLKQVSKGHRKEKLKDRTGIERNVSALLRVTDELDIGPKRAPIAFLTTHQKDMDATSCWHWFKHNIVKDWSLYDNVLYHSINNKKQIEFTPVVTPPTDRSIDYWLRQTMRPILKVLKDEDAAEIIKERWGVEITCTKTMPASSANWLGEEWQAIEQIALSSGKKVILVVDDEVRKMEDLFISLMDDFHIIFSPNARDAFSKMQAINIDLAIVDMQVMSGGLWEPEDTKNFKATGINICQYINKEHPHTKVGILTATKYAIPEINDFKLSFLLRKPVPLNDFERVVKNVFA